MNRKSTERLHFLLQMEDVLKQMNREGNTHCSDAELKSMKHIFKELRLIICSETIRRIDQRRQQHTITPKEAVHQIALCRKRFRQ